MGLKLISRNERYPIETEYITGYDIKVETPRTSLAKMPETKNEMIVTLEVPKSEYKNDINVQTIMKWAEMSVNDQDYFRDIAVHFTTDEGINERSIVLTHAKITLEEFGNVKSDFVEITITINQRRDKFTGVMFGINLDDTYESAWYRANNPPTVNIVVPPDVKNNDIDYADMPLLNSIQKSHMLANAALHLPPRTEGEFDNLSGMDSLFGNLINYKLNFVPNSNVLFFYSDGPEDIKYPKQVLLTYSNSIGLGKSNDDKKQIRENPFISEKYIPANTKIDFEFYHKNYAKFDDTSNEIEKLIVGVILKNEGKEDTTITVYSEEMQSMLENTDDKDTDEKDKENMCADVELNFMKKLNKNNQEKRITLKKDEIKFISFHTLEAKYRMYGRIRFSCNSSNIKARSIATPYEEKLVKAILDSYISMKYACINENDLFLFLNDTPAFGYTKYQFYNEYNFNDLWPAYKNNEIISGNYYSTNVKCHTGQFTGVLNYTELNITITGMEINDYILLGSYERGINNEYPTPNYVKLDGKEYGFGNFGIIYNITLKNCKSNKIKIYPFGHRPEFHANVLLKIDKRGSEFFKTGDISRKQFDDSNYNKLKEFDVAESNNKSIPPKYKDTTSSVRYLNQQSKDITWNTKELKNGTFEVNEIFSFMLSGGNCGGVKFKLVQ